MGNSQVIDLRAAVLENTLVDVKIFALGGDEEWTADQGEKQQVVHNLTGEWKTVSPPKRLNCKYKLIYTSSIHDPLVLKIAENHVIVEAAGSNVFPVEAPFCLYMGKKKVKKGQTQDPTAFFKIVHKCKTDRYPERKISL